MWRLIRDQSTVRESHCYSHNYLNTQSFVFPPADELLVKVDNSELGEWVSSLGISPSKSRKGGSGNSAGVEVYIAPGMQAHFRLAF